MLLSVFGEYVGCVCVCVCVSMSRDAERELMRMERVSRDTSQRVSQLLQQLSGTPDEPDCDDQHQTA